jgi:hypothetical protein
VRHARLEQQNNIKPMCSDMCADFNSLDLTLCEVESFNIEPRRQLSVRFLQRSNDLALVYQQELTFYRIVHHSISIDATPWLQGVVNASCFRDSHFFRSFFKENENDYDASKLLHFQLQIGKNTFDVIAESFSFNLLDIYSRGHL